MHNRMPVELEHLIKALEDFIQQILPKNHNLDVKQLAKDTADILQKNMANIGEQFTVDKLADPKFINQVNNTVMLQVDLKKTPGLVKALNITNDTLADPKMFHQLSISMKLTATMKNSPELMKHLNKLFETLTGDVNDKQAQKRFNDFMEDFKKLIAKPDKKNLKADFKALIQKHYGPEKHGQLLTQFDKFMKEMQKLTPDKKGKKEVDDPYVNLLGVLNSAIAGSHAVPQAQDMGNGLAIPDMNPLNGTANIDKSKGMNFSWGDSMGLTEASEERMESLGSIFKSALHEAGFKFHTSPTALPTDLKRE